MREPLATSEQQTSADWMRFQEVVHPQILAAPRISWDQVDRKLMNYINTSVAETPWVNHLAFLLAVLICYAQLDLKRVQSILCGLHCRFKTIFQVYGLTYFAHWDPEAYFPRYMNDIEFEDSLSTRHDFVRSYVAATGNLQRYLQSLTADERLLYQRWALPPLPAGMSGRLRRTKEVQEAQAMRRKADGEEESRPFDAHQQGLLVGSRADGTADYMNDAQRRTDGLLLLVEPLFVAATFGLACLDFFTTTGARMTELLQLSLSPDCLYTMEVGGTQRLMVRLIPKGTDKPAEYMIGPETRRNLERVMQLLKEHYRLQQGGILPQVSFNPDNNRAHEFTDPRPYLFQYNGAHLSRKAITACMRFLMHGMVFQDAAGSVVVLKAHLLRHVFATHLHQIERVPLDIVAKILHQKNVQVTGYYAAPQWQQIVEATDSLLDRFATHLGDVEEAFVRAPAELQRQLEDAKHKVGALAKVPGGECTCYALCPFSFVCTGCIYKVPDPDREEEVIEQEQWAFIRLEQVKRRGLGPETVNYVG
jgi:integrase